MAVHLLGAQREQSAQRAKYVVLRPHLARGRVVGDARRIERVGEEGQLRVLAVGHRDGVQWSAAGHGVEDAAGDVSRFVRLGD